MTGFLKRYLDDNSEAVMKTVFENEDEELDYIGPKKIRGLKLHFVYEYAIRHGFPEAAEHALRAKETDEDVNDVLVEIGFHFDGVEFRKDDSINRLPSVEVSRILEPKKDARLKRKTKKTATTRLI